MLLKVTKLNNKPLIPEAFCVKNVKNIGVFLEFSTTYLGTENGVMPDEH